MSESQEINYETKDNISVTLSQPSLSLYVKEAKMPTGGPGQIGPINPGLLEGTSISAEVIPGDNTEDLIWSTPDPDIITIKPWSGQRVPSFQRIDYRQIIGNIPGQTTLTVTLANSGVTQSIPVTVKKRPPAEATVKKLTLSPQPPEGQHSYPLKVNGAALQLTAAIEGTGEFDHDVQWTFQGIPQGVKVVEWTIDKDDSRICYCTPLALGKVIITATSVMNDKATDSLEIETVRDATYYHDMVHIPESSETCLTIGGSWSSGYYYAGGFWRFNCQHSMSGTPGGTIGARLIRKPKKK